MRRLSLTKNSSPRIHSTTLRSAICHTTGTHPGRPRSRHHSPEHSNDTRRGGSRSGGGRGRACGRGAARAHPEPALGGPGQPGSPDKEHLHARRGDSLKGLAWQCLLPESGWVGVGWGRGVRGLPTAEEEWRGKAYGRGGKEWGGVAMPTARAAGGPRSCACSIPSRTRKAPSTRTSGPPEPSP